MSEFDPVLILKIWAISVVPFVVAYYLVGRFFGGFVDRLADWTMDLEDRFFGRKGKHSSLSSSRLLPPFTGSQ